jgi:hypothetical protein
MESGVADRIELKYDQNVFMVLGGEGKHAKMLVEDDNLVVFESLWHAGPLVYDLRALGIAAQVMPMLLYALHYMARSMNLGLWIIRHDGTITSIREIVFPS